jgi:amino acid permease
MLKKFFSQDRPIVGVVAGLGSELGFCIALALGLLIAGEPIGGHIRWFGGMFIPVILLLHHYAKRREQLKVTKTIIVVFFVTFLAFMIYLFKARLIVLQ